MSSNYPHLSSMTCGDNWRIVINQLYLTSVQHLLVHVCATLVAGTLCVRRCETNEGCLNVFMVSFFIILTVKLNIDFILELKRKQCA